MADGIERSPIAWAILLVIGAVSISTIINRSSEPDDRPTAPPPAPTRAAEIALETRHSGPLRVGGDVSPPKIVKQVPPSYPEVAKAARVQGIVILEAIINAEGGVDSVKTLRGHALLDQAAKDAIVQWQFEPAKLNGVPVSVYFTLTVNFTLR